MQPTKHYRVHLAHHIENFTLYFGSLSWLCLRFEADDWFSEAMLTAAALMAAV